MTEQPDSTLLYTVREDPNGKMVVELTDEGMLRRLQAAANQPGADIALPGGAGNSFFLAQREPDGRYRVSLTEDGVRAFETALGVANDFGRHSAISSNSTIADLMARTATREELGQVSRQDRTDLLHRLRRAVLVTKYRGSEEPSADQKSISHALKSVIVGLVGLWTLRQFGVAIQDVQAIPGIIAHIPSDIFHLDPGHAVTAVGHKIDDATSHLITGIEGVVATFIVARIIRPLARIYRKDQLVPGGGPALRFLTWSLRLLDHDRHP